MQGPATQLRHSRGWQEPRYLIKASPAASQHINQQKAGTRFSTGNQTQTHQDDGPSIGVKRGLLSEGPNALFQKPCLEHYGIHIEFQFAIEGERTAEKNRDVANRDMSRKRQGCCITSVTLDQALMGPSTSFPMLFIFYFVVNTNCRYTLNIRSTGKEACNGIISCLFLIIVCFKCNSQFMLSKPLA